MGTPAVSDQSPRPMVGLLAGWILSPCPMTKRTNSSPFRQITALLVLLGCITEGLFASSGVVTEIKRPTGTSVERTVVTESWTLATSAGEVLVYSNATGKLVRRLRPPHAAGSIFATYIAASGDFVVVSDTHWSLCAFNCATGKHLWNAEMPYNWTVKSLATDGSRVAAGEPSGMSPQSPVPAEGMVAIFHSGTGQWLAADRTTWGQTAAVYGEAVALSGPWMAVGAYGYDAPGYSNNGMVVVKHTNGTENYLFAPDLQSGDGFGRSVAISGNTLYVGTLTRGRVYLFDLRTLAFISAVDKPSPAIAGFGHELTASGHLLAINSADGSWLYDRQSGVLTSIFAGVASGPVKRGMGLCGNFAAAPAGGRLFRASNVGSSLGGSDVTKVGSVVAGAGVVKMAGFGDASLSGTGMAAFAARLTGTAVNTANDSTLWQGAAGSNGLLLREGTLYGSSKAGTPFSPSFSDDGNTTFAMTRSSTGAVSLWRYNGASTGAVLIPGGSVLLPGNITTTPSKIHCAGPVQTSSAVANVSLKPGNGVYADNDSLIFRPSLISLVEAREGSASGLAGALFAQLHPRLAAAGIRLAFSSFLMGRLPQENAAVFTRTLAGANIAAMEKGDSPVGVNGQFPDAVVSGFLGEAVSAGATLFRCTYKTATFSAEALMSYNHGTSADHSIAWVRGQVPGQAAGVTWKRFLKVFAAENGDAFFLAQIGGPGITTANDLGFWHCALGSNAPKLLLREGSAVPGAGGALISTIQKVDASRDGTWTLLASLSRSPVGRNQILIGGNTASDLGFEVIARKGIAVDRPTPSVLLGLGLPSNNTNAAGMAAAGNGRFANDGKVLHRTSYKEGMALTISGIWGY